jgi:putative RNA 2'-phosphotransferase
MLTDQERKRISKFLSLVLRHQPEVIGIELDDAGWVDVSTLLQATSAHRQQLSRAELEEVVATSDKQRFAFSEDGLRIRASQGHSVDVDLGYSPAEPPAELYHGTVDKFIASIRLSGLVKGQRHHVHLSADVETATKVGKRRGNPVLLVVRSREMQAAKIPFFLSANGVWLTEHVAPQFIQFP